MVSANLEMCTWSPQEGLPASSSSRPASPERQGLFPVGTAVIRAGREVGVRARWIFPVHPLVDCQLLVDECLDIRGSDFGDEGRGSCDLDARQDVGLLEVTPGSTL